MADLLAKCTEMTVVQAQDGMPVILLVMEDFTEHKRAAELLKSEEQLRQKALELIASGRLVSLGEITASMAHESTTPSGLSWALPRPSQRERSHQPPV